MADTDADPSPLAKLNPREEQALSVYYDNLLKISEDVERQAEPGRSEEDVLCLRKPDENSLEPVKDGEAAEKGVFDQNKVERLFRRINEMTAAEMRVELREIHKSPHGSTKELRYRLRQFYRKEFVLIQAKRDEMRMKMKNRKRFRYLVAIDIEATCEAVTNDVNYPHETIELPAVLIDCNTFTIIDKFRTYVRPEINPQISEFCSNFCHIAQSDLDAAPLFPEAWTRLLEWMGRHGMMGDDKDASFAVVTDGPNDVQHFLQRSFLQYKMTIPHEFRHFINIKRVYEHKIERLATKGDGVSSIAKMCEKLGIEMEGAAHEGITDAINVAKIAIALVNQNVHLTVNQRIVKVRNRPLRLPPPADEAEIKQLDEQLKSHHRGNQKPNSSNAASSRLPFVLRNVSSEEFNTEAYWDCDTCDEREP